MKRKEQEEQEEIKEGAGEAVAKRLKTSDPEPPREQLYLEKLKLAPFSALDELTEGRRDCPGCKQSRKFFCYDCYIPLNEDITKLPRLQLPVNVTV